MERTKTQATATTAVSANQKPSSYTFYFYRFTGLGDQRRTETVRDYNLADGMRGLVENDSEAIQEATDRVSEWATDKGITLAIQEPYPSSKHPDKVYLEYRFGGLTL